MKIKSVVILLSLLLTSCSNKEPQEYKKSQLAPVIKIPKKLKSKVTLDDQYKIPSNKNLGGKIDVDLMPPTIKS